MSGAVFRMHGVLCTHGRCDLLRRTLESLAEAPRPAGFEWLWVIENGSDAGARGICADMEGRLPLRYLHRPEQGKAKALQHAMDLLGSGLAVFLDDDTRVAPELFGVYAAAAERHGPEAFYGGPLSIDYEAEPPPAWLLPHLPASAKGWEWPDASEPVRRPLFLGANYAAFVQAVQRVGGFRADLGTGSGGNPVGEETELQERLLAAGLAGVYVPAARVWHYVPRERCTPAWALHRFERLWLTTALREATPPAGRSWRGVPLWVWRRALASGVRAAVGRLHPDAGRRFELRKEHRKWRGITIGQRMGFGDLRPADAAPVASTDAVARAADGGRTHG